MSDTTVYYVTETDDRAGRASAFYEEERKAFDRLVAMNAKAEAEGYKVRYTMQTANLSDVPRKEVRVAS